MVPLSMTLHSASNLIRVQVAGKNLNCPFRSLSGAAVPPGNYTISAPMHNSVYGTFAVLSATRAASGPALHGAAGWINKDWVSPGIAGLGWINKGWVSAPSLNKDWVNSSVNQSGWVTNSGADWVQNVSEPGVYVMVEKAVSVRNAILITGGFTQLMAALQQAGGATVTVA